MKIFPDKVGKQKYVIQEGCLYELLTYDNHYYTVFVTNMNQNGVINIYGYNFLVENRRLVAYNFLGSFEEIKSVKEISISDVIKFNNDYIDVIVKTMVCNNRFLMHTNFSIDVEEFKHDASFKKLMHVLAVCAVSQEYNYEKEHNKMFCYSKFRKTR